MKLIILSIIGLMLLVSTVSATTYGIGGYSFNGNFTSTNARYMNGTGNINHEQLVSSNLNGWWTFDKSSGSTTDDEAGINTLTAGDSGNITWITGKWGNGVEFSNSGLNNNFSGTDYDPSTDITLSYWYSKNATTHTDQTIFEGSRWGQTIEHERQQTLIRNSTATPFAIYDNYNAVNDTWYFCIFTRNYSTGETFVYRDNNQIGTNTDAIGALGDLNYFRIAWGTQDFILRIDDVRYYGKVLNTSERGNVWNNSHHSDATITYPIENATDGYQSYRLMINGTFGDGIRTKNISMRHSTDNISWSSYYSIQTNISPSTWYEISANQTQYWQIKAESNTTNSSSSPITESVIFENEVSLLTWEVNVTQYDNNNITANIIFNLYNISASLTNLNISYSGTNISNEYCLCHPNGTAVQACVTAVSEGETIWFNGSANRLLEANGNYINETISVTTSTIIIPANSLGMFNNWTVETNFSNIAANESNDVCYSYYNVTTGEWESYYPPYSWNADYDIPLEASVFVFVDAETTITAYIITPSNTNLYTGWNMIFVTGTDNETVADIKADIGANCSDVWWFNSTAGAYSNTSTDTVQPCQGFLAYLTQNMTPWTRSDL